MIRIFETDDNIDSFFNGYILDSSSDEEDELLGSDDGINGFMNEDKDDQSEDDAGNDDNSVNNEFSATENPTPKVSKEVSTLDFVRGVKDNMEKDMPEKTSVPAGLCGKAPKGANTQPHKDSKKSKPSLHSTQPIPSTSFNKSDSVSISDSFSNINRCNIRILLKPSASSSSQSNEVENTINETMNSDINRVVLNSMWSNSQFDFVRKKPDGKSRGIVALWDSSYFKLSASTEGDGYLAIVGFWQNIDIPCLFIIVYSPQEQRRKHIMWSEFNRLITHRNTFTIVLGNFNKVRVREERKRTIFDPRGATRFNSFISSSWLIDLPMGAKRVTRMNNLGNKL
ncbi:hypothetical protein Tco_0815176, partial [Tanacetum coccineum]